jgi:hypothetical protein
LHLHPIFLSPSICPLFYVLWLLQTLLSLGWPHLRLSASNQPNHFTAPCFIRADWINWFAARRCSSF